MDELKLALQRGDLDSSVNLINNNLNTIKNLKTEKLVVRQRNYPFIIKVMTYSCTKIGLTFNYQ